MLLVLTGAGLLWLGWSGFNGGATFSANLISGLAVLNTHVCAAASLLTWTTLDVIVFGKPSVIGAVQGMMTGLVVITPAAGKPQCVYHSSHIALIFIICFIITVLAHCRLDYSHY